MNRGSQLFQYKSHFYWICQFTRYNANSSMCQQANSNCSPETPPESKVSCSSEECAGIFVSRLDRSILSRSRWDSVACCLCWLRALLAVVNRPLSHIPQSTCPTSHNALFRTEMCTFLFWMVYCGIWDWWVGGFFRSVYFWFPYHNLYCPEIIIGNIWTYLHSL